VKKTILYILVVTLGLISFQAYSGYKEMVYPGQQKKKLIAFAPEGKLQANIRWTDYGVPHITANNLESLGFGNGYAQAQDNICILADSYIRVNGERSKYFGPDKEEPNDAENLISDLSFKALRLRELAEEKWPQFSENSRAIIQGFVAGYNFYLSKIKTGEKKLPALCADQLWVTAIEPEDVVSYVFSIALLEEAIEFQNLLAIANPGDGDEWLPRPAIAALSNKRKQHNAVFKPQDYAHLGNTASFPNMRQPGVGSNGWALGGKKTDNQRGMLLANPHFPFTGNLRLWQSHSIIPGALNVMGSSLLGYPGVTHIGFNRHVAWTATSPTAERSVFYRLQLARGDRTKYVLDGKEKPIQKRTISLEVKMGPNLVKLKKDLYYTDIGPMVESNNIIRWDDEHAYVIKPANLANMDLIDHWLEMNLASDLKAFQKTFKKYSGVMHENILYSDQKGNGFYIDGSTVPDLSDKAITFLQTDTETKFIRERFGVTILPGHDSDFIYKGVVPYHKRPKLQRRDYTQNANDSHWLTNPLSPLVGFSPLFGTEKTELSLRTRMGLKMINDAAGYNDRFSLAELETALLSNRSYFAELVLDDLLSQCTAQGTIPMIVDEQFAVDVSPGCQALRHWNGRHDKSSIAGHLLREMAFLFNTKYHLENAFDDTDPVNTPNKLKNDGSALVILAHAMLNITNAGWSLDAKLGDIQFVERSLPDGSPSGDKLPWPGGDHVEGGFNVFATHSYGLDTTLYPPKHSYTPARDVVSGAPLRSGLSAEGYHIRFGSSWMMVVGFDDDGPVARGLLSYSQSTNPESDYYEDQTRYYSEKKALRPILYREKDIIRHLQATEVIQSLRKASDR